MEGIVCYKLIADYHGRRRRLKSQYGYRLSWLKVLAVLLYLQKKYLFCSITHWILTICEGKMIPLQARCGPEGG